MSTLREQIFARYHSLHGTFIDTEDRVRQNWICDLVKYNYMPYLHVNAEPVLEIGCGKGHIVQALYEQGIHDIVGIDLSEEDLQIARQRTPVEFLHVSALDFLPTQPDKYGLIISKDVMEHIEFERLTEFLADVHTALKAGGTAIIQVPNMDWFLASHERYMDLTHTIGFTRESLGQLGRLVFGNRVEIKPIIYDFPRGNWKAKLRYYVLRPSAVRLARLYFNALGSGLHDCWFEHREIMLIGVK